jgi:hypothetical protein
MTKPSKPYKSLFIRGLDFDALDPSLYDKTIGGSNFDSDRAITLYKDCFSNHTDYAVPGITELIFLQDSPQRYIQRDNLSSYFVNRVYSPPCIRQYNDRSVLDYRAFLANFAERADFPSSSEPFSIGTNRVKYIVGDVGIGKTAFIRKVYCDLSRVENALVGDHRILSVYINLEQHFHQKETPDSLPDKFPLVLYNAILSRLAANNVFLHKNLFDARNPAKDPLLSLKILIKELHEVWKIRLFLYIDNLDFYHYYYARYTFFPVYYSNQIAALNDNIIWLIRFFEYGEMLGHMGLNVMLAVREYVFNQVTSIAGRDTEINCSQAVVLDPVEEHVVLGARVRLLQDAMEVIRLHAPGAYGALEKLLTIVSTKLLSLDGYTKTPLNDIYRLGQHGHRSIVQFVSSLNISYSDEELVERYLLRQISVLYILYFNNVKLKYSQQAGHFPNLFLNDCLIYQEPGRELAHRPHAHSYWLKYLMLWLLKAKEHGAKVKDIITFFRADDMYDETLIRLVLGGLCTANEFRCAEIDTRGPSDPLELRRVSLTRRGRALIDTSHNDPIGFCLEYLSVVVDDKWLSLPIPYAEDVFKPKSHYGHLFKIGSDYADASRKSVFEKAHCAMVFCRILEASFKMEVEGRLPLFEKAKTLGAVPDFKRIKENVLFSTIRIVESFHAGRSVESDIHKLRGQYALLNADNSFEDFFRDYYQVNPSLVEL